MPAVEAPPAPAAAPASNLNNAFENLGSLFPQQETAPEAAPEAPATPEAPKAKVEPPREVKPVEPAKVEPPKAPVIPPQPEKAKTLREAKDMAEARAKDWEKKYQELERKSAVPKDDPEKKTLAERLSEREKRLAEVEQELKYANYKKHPEYQEKYEKPFRKAFDEGRAFVASLEVVQQVNEAGEVVQQARQATGKDFEAVLSAYTRSPAEGSRMAKVLFGEDMAADVKVEVKKVQQRFQEANEAEERYRAEGSEREKQNLELSARQQQEINSIWDNENKSAIEKYPQWFKPVEGDDKGNELLAKGFQLADLAFTGAQNMPPAERARLHAAIRNKAGGFDRLAHQNTSLAKELKELKSKISEYEDSEPAGGVARRQVTPGEGPITLDSVTASLEKLPRRAY